MSYSDLFMFGLVILGWSVVALLLGLFWGRVFRLLNREPPQ